MRELVGFEKEKDQESQRQRTVVDAVLKKRILRGCQKGKMAAKENERGNVPAHDENAYGHSHDGCAQRIDITQVFGRKKERFGAKALHKGAVHHAEHHEPENKEYLVFPEVQEKQLHG